MKHLDLVPINYSAALQILKARYDHKRILIYTELRTLFSLPSLKIESVNSLKQLLDTTQEYLLALRNYDAPVDHWDCILNYLMEEKLPKRTKQCWEEKIGDSTDIPPFKDFLCFLNSRFRTLEMVELSGTANNKAFHLKNGFNSNNTISRENKSFQCVICKGNHLIYRCQKFAKFNVKTRQDVVKKSNLCINCLSNTHKLNGCLSNRTCNLCNKKHHTLLHYNTNNNQTTNRTNTNSNTNRNRTFSNQTNVTTNNDADYCSDPIPSTSSDTVSLHLNSTQSRVNSFLQRWWKL